ncbi:HlyD family efflux transporter periplasmic adaptor subunit [Aliifodinibius salicampi]|uniref:HlyD family efflux transporter periplasmic adaptor subunit n=1 Tax=Fodinibius salicampi TaxID=1920655 RepID=A0ABT3Q1Q4_9BACT|nr:HlyD family efflux transporter periplasmic adaptor subunit [Fodinibius salicampi]MCW9714054.1 HlyD family efflux transporter periplasmic adaptor subunit [Fodinibius salicampi]
MLHINRLSQVTIVRHVVGKLHWFFYTVPLLVLLAGCASEEKSDTYGQFEATETSISSEVPGKLIKYTINEGDRLDQNTQVGQVDTTRLSLQKKELRSQLESVRSKIENIDAQVAVQQEELALARTNLKRTEALHEDGAATEQQLDDTRTKVQTMEKRIRALQTEKQSIRAEMETIRTRIEQVEDQIDDALIMNPVNGTVLTSFVETYEMIRQGQPLYEIANLDTLELRVYISGAQLPSVKLGQRVEVLVDKNAEENQAMEGKVSWIASEAEFTPKMIQTKEERVTQVYAVKVRVPNPNGILKIGMPGEVNFE